MSSWLGIGKKEITEKELVFLELDLLAQQSANLNKEQNIAEKEAEAAAELCQAANNRSKGAMHRLKAIYDQGEAIKHFQGREDNSGSEDESVEEPLSVITPKSTGKMTFKSNGTSKTPSMSTKKAPANDTVVERLSSDDSAVAAPSPNKMRRMTRSRPSTSAAMPSPVSMETLEQCPDKKTFLKVCTKKNILQLLGDPYDEETHRPENLVPFLRLCQRHDVLVNNRSYFYMQTVILNHLQFIEGGMDLVRGEMTACTFDRLLVKFLHYMETHGH